MTSDPVYVRPLCQSPGVNPDDWFSALGSDTANAAKAVCMACPLYWECQEYALAEGVPYGIWGGLDERQRGLAWKRNGGRPTGFLDSIVAAIGPELDSRGMREGWARLKADRDDDTFTSDYSVRSGNDAA